MSPDELQTAVETLLKTNNYEVFSSPKIAGAQIDILAKSLTDIFAPNVYIEVTTQYVDNTKYGKDATKFMLIKEIDNSAKCVLISSVGFTPDVVERAKASRVETFTYQQFFSKFEQFDPYLTLILGNPDEQEFNRLYEEPHLVDGSGNEFATDFFDFWNESNDRDTRWIVVLGEYGSGKTALTKVLLYRWLSSYRLNPLLTITIRIELRDFTRQFDARSLLHHFLDTNRLSHIPVEFLFRLMRENRVVLILDGYDEMAQFLNARERRACLNALAVLSSSGARGIITSRPNYFTESEELYVFEILYRHIEEQRYFLTETDKRFIEEEKSIDHLIEHYLLERRERWLEDLDPTQTENLVNKKLGDRPIQCQKVLAILKRVFRDSEEHGRLSLGGKPVIISFLLEVIDFLPDLKDSDEPFISEYGIYKIIVDHLMLRDQRNAYALSPIDRRACLQNLAIRLSGRDESVADEVAIREILLRVLRRNLHVLSPEERVSELERLSEDLRRSATLTRAQKQDGWGWKFSHNSLREYLVVENILQSLKSGNLPKPNVPVSEAMRRFVASLDENELDTYFDKFKPFWRQRSTYPNIGKVLEIFWDGFLKRSSKNCCHVESFISDMNDGGLSLSSLELEKVNIDFSRSLNPIHLDAGNSTFKDVSFKGGNYVNANFAGSVFDTVIFVEIPLRNPQAAA